MDLGSLSPCGLNCAACEWYTGKRSPPCAGCREVKGTPFWGSCKTYTCAASRRVEHCGICGEFPCDRFIEQYDPNNPEGQRDAVYRAGLLAYRKKHGDEATRELIGKTERTR